MLDFAAAIQLGIGPDLEGVDLCELIEEDLELMGEDLKLAGEDLELMGLPLELGDLEGDGDPKPPVTFFKLGV